MSTFVSVYANGKKGDKVVTVTEAFARNIGAEILEDEPAVDNLGKPLEPRDEGAYLNPPETSFAPAIKLPDDFEPKDESEQDPDDHSEPPLTTGATGAPATHPFGGPTASSPEEATQ